jgi:cytoskeletal protein RodZ
MRTDFSPPRVMGTKLPRRLILTKSIRELPAETDEQIGYEFRRLRVASGLSINRLSAMLGISLRTLEELEKGALAAIPDHARAQRLVMEYSRIAHLDPRALLSRLKAYDGTRDMKQGEARWARARRRRTLRRGGGVIVLVAAAVGAGLAATQWPETASAISEAARTTLAGWVSSLLAHLKMLLATGAR